jgi:hypothetical protein
MTQETLYFVDAAGNYLGGYCGVEPPSGSVQVQDPPPNAAMKLINTGWTLPGELIPANISSARYDAEIAGITVNGMFIDTGRDSQALITGAALSAFMDDTYICNWKTPDGFVEIDAPTLISVSKAVRVHVQACFDREAALLEALAAGTYTDAMLDEGWPA